MNGQIDTRRGDTAGRRDIGELEDRLVCAECIGEAYLRAKVRRDGRAGLCDYCRNAGRVTTIEALANEIDSAFEGHYRRTAEEPEGFEYALIKELGWERGGDPVAFMIGDAAQVDEAIAEDIRLVLEELHVDVERDQRVEEGPFDEEAHYVRKEPDDVEYQHMWRDFENSLKSEARFFGASAEAVLKDVFQELGTYRNPFAHSEIVEAGPDTARKDLYRARAFQSTKALEDALKRPAKDVGPPPSTLATAGRMNAHGIAVFYGATSRTVAISEVRPPVGSQVVAGRFELLRKIRLLDVDALRSVFIKGSVFDPEYLRRRERAKFLQSLSERIARPVMPNDEPLEYVVTQAIADFLAGRSDSELDGMIYASVQDRSGGRNVMLFHEAARVERMNLAEGTEIETHSMSMDDDGLDVDYWVSIEMGPATEEEKDLGSESVPSVARMLKRSHTSSAEDDLRELTLRLDRDSLTVHRVKGVQYDAPGRKVDRNVTNRTKKENS